MYTLIQVKLYFIPLYITVDIQNVLFSKNGRAWIGQASSRIIFLMFMYVQFLWSFETYEAQKLPNTLGVLNIQLEVYSLIS